ncbi:MAG: hypothetical protein N3A61_01675, partial [Ignavibacteria bacterium]|nr:hypothetical protein [Ignavibacteria bacterium]
MKFILGLFCFQLVFFLSFGYAQINNVSSFELKTIEFNGNDFASSSTLRGVIASKETPFWFWKFLNSFTNLGKEAVYFDSSLISKDIKLLQAFYQDNGFFQAKISAHYEIDSLDKSAKIFFDIEENGRCEVNSINYPGLETKISPQLYSLIMDEVKIKKWDKFSRDLLENDLNRIIDVLKNFGYMLAERQQVIVKIDTLNKLVEITAYIEPGNYYEIKDIRVDKKGPGKASVEDDLIYDLVRIKPGDRYDLSEIN